jgi:uncharacterized protein
LDSGLAAGPVSRGRAQQRIDYTLERLRRAGYVRRFVPVGSTAADIARVFEHACREHASRLTRNGGLPEDMIIGRWWRDEAVEVDVLGITGDRTGLLGECRWQIAPLTGRDLIELERKISFVPEPAEDVALMFWTRTGAVAPGFHATAFSAADIVG